jgi:hypothetical protein
MPLAAQRHVQPPKAEPMPFQWQGLQSLTQLGIVGTRLTIPNACPVAAHDPASPALAHPVR